METKIQHKRVKPIMRVRVGPSFRKITNTLFETNISIIAEHYSTKANFYLKENGPVWTCSRLKDYYNLSTRLALDLQVKPINFCKSNDRGIPKDLLPFVKFLTSKHTRERRAALTVLRSYTQLHSKVNDDTSSITKPGSDQKLFEDYKEHFDKICMKYRRFLKPMIFDEGIYTSTKKGPNGPALIDCDKDYAAITEGNGEILNTILLFNTEIEKLSTFKPGREVKLNSDFHPELDSIIDQTDTVNNLARADRKLTLYRCMDRYCAWRIEKDPTVYDNVRTSKISFIAEGGCKTRVIAIGDYFTQDALKPLHKSLYSCLRKLETDGTFSHNRISELVKKRTSENVAVRSFDLTAATDRFPIFIQRMMLSNLYNETLARLWEKLMVDRQFYVTDAKIVRYECGQPMGFLSSWAAFALTHHIIIETCALRVGLTSFKDYVVIGDDVTIFNTKVSDEYKKFLNTFDIQISEAKSLESEGNPSSAEIAKRLFKDGEELSPLPFDAIESAIKDRLLFPNLIRMAMERDVISDKSVIPVHSILKDIYPKGQRSNDVLALLSCPLNNFPLGIVEFEWDEDESVIKETFETLRIEFIKSKAKGLYENELMNIPDMGPLGLAMESDDGPAFLNQHPFLCVLRAYRDKCGTIYQGIVLNGLESSDLELIDYLVDPMIPQYMRRSHRIERVRSNLILKTFRYFKTLQ